MDWRSIMNMKNISKYGTVLAAMLVFAGCATVGPDYVKPDIKAPHTWNSGAL